jgi:hypothetical protein
LKSVDTLILSVDTFRKKVEIMPKSALEQFRERQQKQQEQQSLEIITGEIKEEKISVDLTKFFNDVPNLTVTEPLPPLPDKPVLPTLPDRLMPFQVLYNATFPGRGMEPDTARTVLDLINEAADILNGKLTGRMWQSTLEEHVEALQSYEDALYTQILDDVVPAPLLTLEWWMDDLSEAEKAECRELYGSCPK